MLKWLTVAAYIPIYVFNLKQPPIYGVGWVIAVAYTIVTKRKSAVTHTHAHTHTHTQKHKLLLHAIYIFPHPYAYLLILLGKKAMLKHGKSAIDVVCDLMQWIVTTLRTGLDDAERVWYS